MGKILFVDPPGWQRGLNVGLMYLAGSLHANGHEARNLDFNNTPCTKEQLVSTIREF